MGCSDDNIVVCACTLWLELFDSWSHAANIQE